MAAVAGHSGSSGRPPKEDVYLMIRRQKMTIFLEMKEEEKVLELKMIVGGITKVAAENLRLFNGSVEMRDERSLAECGLTSTATKAYRPAPIDLVYRAENGNWETVDIAPLSHPPELPDVMNPYPAQR